MVPDSGNATGRLMVTSRSRGLARNFSCGNFVVVCGVDFETYDNGYLPVNSYGDVWAALPSFCSAWSPGECSGGNSVSNGSASYNWTIGATSMVAPASSSQLTVESPQVLGVAAGTGSGYAEVEGGSCQSGGSGPAVVQIPTASAIVSTVSSAAASCPSGYAGWDRVVTKIVTDQETPPQGIVAAGQSLTEVVTIGTPNALGMTNIATSSATTNAAGNFNDHFLVCSTACPKSTGSSVATQVITDVYNAKTYTLTPNTITFKCTSITVNGN
jgi:hypothetical protein